MHACRSTLEDPTLIRWLLVLALSLSIGLQWAVVQGAAWMGMFVSYSKESSISQTLSRTFGGLHPCKLCKAAQQGEATQERQASDNTSVKIVLAAPEAEPFTFSQGEPAIEQVWEFSATRWSHPPPLPPPKTA